jgi:hypothetical protein
MLGHLSDAVLGLIGELDAPRRACRRVDVVEPNAVTDDEAASTELLYHRGRQFCHVHNDDVGFIADFSHNIDALVPQLMRVQDDAVPGEFATFSFQVVLHEVSDDNSEAIHSIIVRRPDSAAQAKDRFRSTIEVACRNQSADCAISLETDLRSDQDGSTLCPELREAGNVPKEA